jgi:hypothetical protein
MEDRADEGDPALPARDFRAIDSVLRKGPLCWESGAAFVKLVWEMTMAATRPVAVLGG